MSNQERPDCMDAETTGFLTLTIATEASETRTEAGGGEDRR